MEEIAVARFGDGQAFGIQLMEIGSPEVPAGEGRLTTPTGLQSQAERGVRSLSSLLSHIADEIGREISSIQADHRPTSVEAEVCLGLSAQAGPVWLSGKGEYTLRAKLVWGT